MTQAYELTGPHDKQVSLPAHPAAALTELFPVFQAPVNCKVSKVTARPGAAVTGQNTNTTHINLINMGTGAGVAELGSYDLVAGNDLAVGAARVLYQPPAALSLNKGEMLGVQLEKIGTGLDVPPLAVIVEFEQG